MSVEEKTVAIIPVRGGSQSIPLKNIKPINGRPLVYWTIDAGVACKYIDKVYVSTDSDIIKECVEKYAQAYDCKGKLECIDRDPMTATDTASTESVMIDFSNKYDYDNLMLIQATSPLLTSEDLDSAMEKYSEGDCDSMLSVVRQKRFIWGEGENGYDSQNYDYLNRPRRQEFDGYFVENGAFYITSQARFEASKCRISGKIDVYEMSEDTFFEIDEPSDWVIVEKLLKDKLANSHRQTSTTHQSVETAAGENANGNPNNSFAGERTDSMSATTGKKVIEDKQVATNIATKKAIKLFVTDCDGCMTDGGMYYSEKGDELKKFNTLDGMAIQLLREAGIKTAIITGEKTDIVRCRAEKLHIDHLHQGVKNKIEVLKEIAESEGIGLDEIAYVGDDINDIDCVSAVGIGMTTPGSNSAVKACADIVLKIEGGYGAIREAAEIVLSLKR